MLSSHCSDTVRAQIQAEFVAQRGYWRPWTQTLLEVNPGFVRQYARYAGYPARVGPLTPRMVELIYVALDASASHLFASGLTTHMRKALESGATEADIFDVLHLVAVQGLSSVCQGADILLQSCAADDAHAGQGPALIDPRLQARIDQLGPTHALALASIARLDPGYAEVLLDFVEHAGTGCGLSPAERSLVQLALHGCFTAFAPEAVRTLITTALAQGCTRAALLQVLQLGAHLAVHGTALGASVYAQMAPISLPLSKK